jgi:prevent-host-death family protein
MTTTAAFTDVRDKLSDILDNIEDTGEAFIITRHSRPTAVLLGIEEYQSLLETLNIMSDDDTMDALAEADLDIAEGRIIAGDE